MKLLRKIRALFRLQKLDVEMAEEMRAHVELQTQANLKAGMSPEEADYAARRQFGGEDQIKEVARAQRTWAWLEDLQKDVRHALRSVRRAPGFTAVAVLTLALGVGTTTAIFSVVDAVLWRPLAFDRPDRLVTVRSASSDDLAFWREQVPSLVRWEAHAMQTMLLSGGPEPKQVSVTAVSPGLLALLGRAPAFGRVFLPDDEQPGNSRVAVISDGFWKRQFGGDPNAIGQAIVLDGQAYRVVGIMPEKFAFPRRGIPVWIPLVAPATVDGRRPARRVEVLGRLAAGATLAGAQAELQLANAQLDQAQPAANPRSAALQGLNEFRTNPGPRRAMLLFLVAVGFVLLIACVNVATLMLARGAARHREIAIRSALGAGRGRILRQLLTESLVLAALGSAGGLLTVVWTVRLLWAFTPAEITFFVTNEAEVDYRVLAFVCLLTGVTTLLSGLLPAWRTIRGVSAQPPGGGQLARTSTAGPAQTRFLRALVVIEVALSFVLLAGAGLMVRSFVKLSEVSPGFDAKNLLALTLTLPRERYPDLASQRLFFDRLQSSLRTTAGVTAVTRASGIPPTNGGFYVQPRLEIEGREAFSLGVQTLVPFNAVAADYFRLMGIPIVRGRAFDAQEAPGAPLAVIINQPLAAGFWPGGDPIGQRIRFGERLPWMTVVGVAGDVRAMGPGDANGSFEIYTALDQAASLARTTLVIRTAAAPAMSGETVKRQVWALDPNLPVAEMDTAEHRMAGTMEEARFYLVLMSAFGAAAIALVVIGLYGVMAYSVALRTREMGIRLALGSSRRALFALVLRHGSSLALAGIVVGLVAAVGLTRFLKSLLFGVSPGDPLTLALIAGGVGVVTLLACSIPARRATRVDPVTALKDE